MAPVAGVRDRIPLWQAALWVLVGGLGAQLAGALIRTIAMALTGSFARPPDADPLPEVLILARFRRV